MKAKHIILSLLIGVTLLGSAAATLAAENPPWQAIWHHPDSWADLSSMIPARDIAEDLLYILGLFNGNCTEHNIGLMRYMEEQVMYCDGAAWVPATSEPIVRTFLHIS